MTLFLALLVFAFVLLLIAAAPLAGGIAFVLLAVAAAIVLFAVALGGAATLRRMPRAREGQFLGPGGPDDPDRPGPS